MSALRRRWRRIAVYFAVALVVVLSGACLAGRAVSRRFVMPGAEDRFDSARSAQLGLEVVAYDSADGVRLEGARIRGRRGDAAPLLLYFHGNAESAATASAIAAYWSRALGVDAFVAEYRGYGGAGGEPSEAGLYADGRAALAATGRAPEEIVTVGFSLGSAVALELAHEGEVRGAVLLAPFTSIPDAAAALARRASLIEHVEREAGRFAFVVAPSAKLVDSPLGALLIADHFDAREKAATTRPPVWIVHGDADEVVPQAEGRELADLLPRATFVAIPGGEHTPGFDDATLGALRAACGLTAD